MVKRKSISVVIPTFNEQQNIDRCLRSIFTQKYLGKVEVILADGGSTDKTISLARKYKVKIVKNVKRDAESGKMLGLRKSTGYYFMILDADMDLVSKDYFNKMVKPLEDNIELVGSFTKFVSYKTDTFLSKYITIDPIQRDPLFRFLTPDPEQVVVKKFKDYWICNYTPSKIVPAGFCIYRRKDLERLKIDKRHKFMELDTLSIFVHQGLTKFGYVKSAGLHHPFLRDILMLIRKRKRNLNTQYFNQPDIRKFTWIDYNNQFDKLKIILWLVYSYSIIFPALVGFYRAVKYRNIIALYEPVFVWVTTTIIVMVFLTNKHGRSMFFARTN